MFTEALGWEHGRQFLCVAFQNRVAYAMGGTTLHTGGDIKVGNDRLRKLDHTDVDVLFTRNQDLRWVLADEVGMIADELLGEFEEQLSEAAVDCRYRYRADGSARLFGGYNLACFGDLFQIPPIPSSAALFLPPKEHTARPSAAQGKSKTERARTALNIF